MIFDTHAHYDDDAFDEDREEVIASLLPNGIGKVVNVGAHLLGSKRSVELANKYDFIYAAVGVHPDDAKEIDDEGIEALRGMAKDKKVVAIGEIGLDYYWNKENAEIQKEAFKRQIELAKELKLPIIVHSREAAADTMDILKECNAGEAGGVIHCFSYSKEIALEAVKMDFYIGIGGVLTFKNGVKLKEVAEVIPEDRILLETDCPYLSPVPLRGKRNSSINLHLVVEELARIRGISIEEVEDITYNNALKMYKLS